MSRFRQRIERGFEALAHLIYAHRLKTLTLMMIGVAALALQIPKITIDTSTEGFLHADDPTLVDYNAFRDQFGRDEVIILAVEPPSVFNRGFLERLGAFHRELEEGVPYIDDITSLINARNTRGEANRLVVEDLLETLPETEADMVRLERRIMTNAMYRNLLISEDGRLTTVVIRTHSHSAASDDAGVLEGFDDAVEPGPEISAGPAPKANGGYLTDRENSEAVEAARRIAKRFEAPDFKVWIAGSPVVTHFLKQAMMRDMRKFMLLSIVAMALLLFAMFRRVSGVLLPLFVVTVTLLSTLGLMAATATPIKVPTQILPSFLLAVSVGASVHILAIFFQNYRGKTEKAAAIAHAMGHSGLAVLMTSTTTAAGLISFANAEVAPIADIGVFAGIGVIISLVCTIVLLPALLALFTIKPSGRAGGDAPRQNLMDRLLTGIGRVSTTRSRWILTATAVILVVSLAGASRIRFSHDPLRWFPPDNEIRTATETLDRNMRGTLSLEVIVDTGEENGFYDPVRLDRLEGAVRHAESMEYENLFVGKAWCLTTILKEIHQALNENRPEFYAVPDHRDLVAQELLLFENSGSDDLEDFVDSQFSKARLIVKAPFEDAIRYGKFLEQAEAYFQTAFPDSRVTLTGMMALLARTLSNAIVSLARSYVWALLIITVLMILLIGRLRIGLLSMIPNLAPILLTLGMMGFLSIPMDLFTMMVGSIAIGLAVDDTIHFMHNFRRYYEHGGDPVEAVHRTLHTTGRAMLVTSVVLSLGFFIFTFATMKNLFNFGLLTAVTILTALAADYFIAPALMVVVNKRHRNPIP